MLRAVAVLVLAFAVVSGALMAASCNRSPERRVDRGEPEAVAGTPEPAATPPPSKCQPVTGASGATTWAIKTPCEAPDSYFKLAVDGPATVAAGAPATFKVEVTPATGYKVNYCPPDEEAKDLCSPFPVALKVNPPSGVTVATATLTDQNAIAFDKQRLVMHVEARPGSAGTVAIPADFKFSVCDDANCIPCRVELAFGVAVQ